MRTVVTNRKVQTSCCRINLGALLRGQSWISVKACAACGSRAGDGTTVFAIVPGGADEVLWLAQGTRQEDFQGWLEPLGCSSHAGV